jgi:hypothetical protein
MAGAGGSPPQRMPFTSPASRPVRVQACQADLVEAANDVTDGVLVGLHEARDHRDSVPARRRQQLSMGTSSGSTTRMGMGSAA